MLETTIAGSLPKPSWLAEPGMLWAPWRLEGDALLEAKRDATLLALKLQEDAGIDILSDGEQSRQHFVHGFLEGIEGIDFARRVPMGIRNNRYEALVPTVTAPLRRRGAVHASEAMTARRHTSRRLKFTLPGPMTIVDTVADAHYGDRALMAMAFAELLNEEARELAEAGSESEAFAEIGDLLFAVVSLARKLKVNPEDALRVSGRRFLERYKLMDRRLREAGRSYRELSAGELEEAWAATR